MKKLILVLTVLIIVISTVAYSEDYQVMHCIVNPDSHVNIRVKPNKRSEICGYLLFGYDVKVLNIKNGWAYCEVSTEYSHGYIKAEYLTTSKPEIVDKDMIVSSDGRVAMRTYKDGDRCKWLKNGEEVHVYCMIDDWAITSNNWRFIKSEYLIDKE